MPTDLVSLEKTGDVSGLMEVSNPWGYPSDHLPFFIGFSRIFHEINQRAWRSHWESEASESSLVSTQQPLERLGPRPVGDPLVCYIANWKMDENGT